MIRTLPLIAILALAPALSGCATALIAGAATGAAVGVTTKAVGAGVGVTTGTVKAAGRVAGAAIPGGDDDDEIE